MFGKKLKMLREQHGFTQKELSDMLGVTAGTVGMWEQGRRTPPVATLKKVVDLMSVDVMELIGAEAEPTEEEVDQLGRWAIEDDYRELFEKIYRLDEYGQAAVDQLIRSEFIRCAEQKTLRKMDLTVRVAMGTGREK